MQEKKKLLALVGFPLFVVAFITSTVVFWDKLGEIFSNLERIEAFLGEHQSVIVPYFVLIQIVQVVFFFIPGELIQIAGGYLFPFWQALGLTSLGICIGGVLNYFFGRVFGHSFFVAVLGEKKVTHYIRYFTSDRAWTICAILFLIPGFPKDILCYIAGIVALRPLPFFIIAGIARLPGIVGTIFMGQAISEQRWLLLTLLGIGSVGILFFVHRYRASISRWTSRLSGDK